MADPDLQIGGGGGKGGLKFILSAPRASVWSKNKGGNKGGGAGPSPGSPTADVPRMVANYDCVAGYLLEFLRINIHLIRSLNFYLVNFSRKLTLNIHQALPAMKFPNMSS